ncbi:MAG: V-type ATPase subunit [Acidilobaceae archaeon]
MARPWDYAESIVVARAIKSRLLRLDVIREAALASDLGEALLALRESIYTGLSESKTLTQALTALWSSYFKTVRYMARFTPGEAIDSVMAMEREEDLRDLLVVMQRAYSGRPLDERLPSTLYEGTLTSIIVKDPEALTSYQKIGELAARTWASSYVNDALRVIREVKVGLPIIWAIPLLIVKLHYSHISKLSGAKRRGLENLLCPHLEDKILSSLILAKNLDIPVKLLETLWAGIRICDFSLESIRSVYEREADPLSLAGELRGVLRDIKIEGKTMQDILSSSRKSSRLALRRNAIHVMSGYPFNPAFLVSSLILLRLEVDDILFILSSKAYKIPPDQILQNLSFEV